MATSLTCETCGLSVPPDASVCPRDGTVVLSRHQPDPAAHDSLEAPVPGVSEPEGFANHEPTLTSRDPLLGLKLGEYELRQRIGVGGMGLVYDGIQPVIGKRVAVKVLRPELAQAPEQVARLLAEARAVNAIRHRGIIDIFGFGQVPDGRQYIVMEFLDGQALDGYLAEKGKLPVTEALSILDEVLAALAAAHGAGVVHRDLKPSNIFLVRQPDGSRYVKLLDFGLAKQSRTPTGRTAQTRTDMVVGTPEYMAPEQARGQEVGPMTDLYAMGVVTFEMVTGQLPFTGTSPVDLLMKHVDARPPRPSEYVADLPAGLDAFILQMLTKDPETRPGSADALRQQLQRLRRTLVRPARTAQQRSATAAPPALAPTPAPKPAAELPPPPVPTQEDETTEVPRRASPAAASPATDEPTTQEVTVVSGGRSRRMLVPVGIGVAMLLATGGAAIVYGKGTHGTPAPADKDTAPFVVAPTPAAPEHELVPPKPPSTPAEATATAQPPATEPATPATPPAEVAQPTTPPANPLEPPVRKEGEPAVVRTEEPSAEPTTVKHRPRESAETPGVGPAQHVLLARIQMLERDLEARVAAGTSSASSAAAGRSTLDKYRQRVRDARDAKTRREIAVQLSSWERFFLKRQ
jgi:serine/threonine-protein kinase